MKQITIIAPIRDGLVAQVSELLGDADVNIESLDAMDVKDRLVVTLTVDKYDEVLRMLRDAGFDAFSDDAKIINIADRPGALAKIARRLYGGGIRVTSIRILYRQYGEALVAVAMDQPKKGMTLIQDLLLHRSE